MPNYNNTSEIKPSDDILSQKRVEKAIELGLKVDNPTYNIYVAGEPGLGKSRYVSKMIEKKKPIEKKYKDWCYLYNFKNPREPMITEFDPGKGKEFKEDVENLLENILEELNNVFESEGFELGKSELLEEYETKKEYLLKKIKKYGEDKGFVLKNTGSGIVFMPKHEENEESEEDFDEVAFEKNKKELEKMAIQVVYKLKDLEVSAEEAVSKLEKQIAEYIINPLTESLKEKYKGSKSVSIYLDHYSDEIIKDMDLIYVDADATKPKLEKDFFKKYKVNLFINNSDLEVSNAIPVVTELNPTPLNLFGRAEYDYSNGNIKTDFTKLLPGSAQKANGGYLILHSDQLFRNAASWEMIKRALRSQSIELETQTSLKPQNMPLDFKIILIGNKQIYNTLYSYEQDFRSYFKVLVDFDDNVENNEKSEDLVAQYIALKCSENNLRHLEYKAVQEVIKHCTKMVGDVGKISTKLDRIDDILIEANAMTASQNNEFIKKEDVIKALKNKKERISKIEQRLNESVEEEFTLIETSGSRVGVINGLSVLNTGEYSFGRPSRITATTSPGNKGIVNIEREVDMSGAIHNKGILILGGYLAENFAQDFVLSLNAYICFEQNYGGIDGDSASSAELYVLLSSLSDIPIKQNIAVTGSINQKGDIQVVGGISEKVEGFYTICKIKGLVEGQGVIIPKNNFKNLVLSDELNEEIKAGRFAIHTVDRVEEAIEILTDSKFDHVKEKVKNKLLGFSRIQNKPKEKN
nr:AAA family ATPase [Clostridioides sp.]